MRSDSLVVALVLVAVALLTLGSFVTLATETVVGARPLVVVVLLVAALLGSIALGVRSRRRLSNPYW
ncbi:hypothetical protein [Halalkalicoccus ordinarius]|uniref:hypothetical protein n=1 Tax=Halalkalicoccus ordinarius TaxID=3116651 RepID=UPI00300E7122